MTITGYNGTGVRGLRGSNPILEGMGVNNVLGVGEGVGTQSRENRPPYPRNSANDPLAWLVSLLDVVGSQPVSRLVRQCPAHEDAHVSLSLGRGEDGRVLMRCHAGCQWRDVVQALSLSASALFEAPLMTPEQHAKYCVRGLRFPKLESQSGGGLANYRHESFHQYGDRYLERKRNPDTGDKALVWWTKRDGVLIPGLQGVVIHELPLYNEPDIRAGITLGEVILLVESESSADALTKDGWYTTTWAGSATSVPIQRLSSVLGGYDKVIYVADMDDAGLRCAVGLRGAQVCSHLVIGRVGEDAKDLYGRAGADAFANLIGEVLSGDAEERIQAG